MCGRYAVISKLKIIEREFDADVSEVLDRFKINPNVSPGDDALVIASDAPGQIQFMKFGFTPSWVKKKMYVINARSEGDHNQDNDPHYTGAKGIISKPMFKKAIRSQRCIVIADAFVEGSTTEKLNNPHLIYQSTVKKPFAMAGIWDEWTDEKTGEVIKGFAIITTPASPLLQEIPYHRGPMILSKNDEKRWLDIELPLHEVTAMLHPFDDRTFNAYPIAKAIKSSRNKQVEVLKPTGDRLRKEYDYVLYEELELQGMGETTARKRKLGEQLDLFNL